MGAANRVSPLRPPRPWRARPRVWPRAGGRFSLRPSLGSGRDERRWAPASRLTLGNMPPTEAGLGDAPLSSSSHRHGKAQPRSARGSRKRPRRPRGRLRVVAAPSTGGDWRGSVSDQSEGVRPATVTAPAGVTRAGHPRRQAACTVRRDPCRVGSSLNLRERRCCLPAAACGAAPGSVLAARPCAPAPAPHARARAQMYTHAHAAHTHMCVHAHTHMHAHASLPSPPERTSRGCLRVLTSSRKPSCRPARADVPALPPRCRRGACCGPCRNQAAGSSDCAGFLIRRADGRADLTLTCVPWSPHPITCTHLHVSILHR